MESLEKVYTINQSISDLRKQMLELLRNDSQRCVELDSVVLIKAGKIRMGYNILTHERNREIKQAYSYSIARPKTAPPRALRNELKSAPQKVMLIGPIITLPKLKVTTMIIGKNSTTCGMTPKWFKPDDESKILKTIKYPPNVTEHRPYNTVARFRSVKEAKNSSNDFTSQPIQVEQNATETLVLALDAFVQQFGGKLSFTTEDLSFEESAHRTACGVADLGCAHLLASEHIPSAKFALIVDLDYDELTKSEETMQQFLLTFADAVARDLSCDNDYVRVTSVEKSSKGKGKAEVSLVLTTPDKTKTEELAETFQEHARLGFSDDTILKHIKPDEYQCKWMPILSYLQLQPLDFDPDYNFDYTQPDLPTELTRGKLPYFLPAGWYRHALKVDKKYKNGSLWLGSKNVDGEWPVAFHGTRSHAVKSIANKGLLTSSIVRDRMLAQAIAQKGEAVNRPGLYVATHCNGGSHPYYTENFEVQTSDGKTEAFHVVFQCRVRPDSYTIHTDPVRVGEAWRVVDPEAVRPYGILLKNTNIKVEFEEEDPK